MVPVLAAIPVVAPIPVTAFVVPAALPPTAAAETTLHMGEDPEPSLLAIVECLVKRIGRIGDLLQSCRRGRHVVGALTQASDRIVRLLRIRRIILLRVHPRVG